MPNTLCRWLRAALLTTLGTASAAPFLPSSNLAAQAVRDALAPESSTAAQVPQSQAARSNPAPATVPQPRAQAVEQKAATPNVPVAKAPAPKLAAQKVFTQKAALQKVPAQNNAQARPRPVQVAAKAPVARKPASNAQTPKAQTPKAQTAAQVRARGVQLAPAGRTPVGRSVVARATAYNSMPGQTDSTPFITATGTRTRPGVVALSRDLLRTFPYGSKVMIEDLTGRSGNLLHNRVFYVEDTMAAYKTRSVDIWMASYGQAIRFGARQVRVTAVR